MLTVYLDSGSHLSKTCELREWAADNDWGVCSNTEPQNHHVLPRSLLRNNKTATKLVEKTYGDFLMAVFLVEIGQFEDDHTKTMRAFQFVV